jgi:magnesium-transporting ATPase (P-type)
MVITDFREAGIKFFMITGDKGPTAKTISSTTGCTTKDMFTVDCEPHSTSSDFDRVLNYAGSS